MNSFLVAIDAFAPISCLICTILLFRGYLQKRMRLLLWSSICFACLTVSNALLFADLVVFPRIDLRLVRLISALIGMLFLLHGFIWESEENS